MVVAEFSETSFSFVFTRELINRFDPDGRIAPYFPTTVEEGRGTNPAGYDVGVSIKGQFLYFQYKVPEQITTNNGTHKRDFGVPYYTVRIRRSRKNKTPQHDVLKQLAVTQPYVFYAMPAFAETRELNRAFFRNEVLNRSLWIPVGDLDPFGRRVGTHQIVYRTTRNYRWHSSEHDFDVARSAEEWISEIQSAVVAQDSARIDVASVHNLLDFIQGLVGPFEDALLSTLAPAPDLAAAIRSLGHVTSRLLKNPGTDRTDLMGRR